MENLAEIIIPLSDDQGLLTVRSAQSVDGLLGRLLSDVTIVHCDQHVRIAMPPKSTMRILFCTGCGLRLKIPSAINCVGGLAQYFKPMTDSDSSDVQDTPWVM